MRAVNVGWVLLTILLLAACGATAPVDEKAATREAGYGRAFGRVEFVQDGKETAWSSSGLIGDGLTLFVRPVRTGPMQYMDIEGDGSFYWSLQPGEYVIIGYQVVRRGWTAPTQYTGRLMSTFSVLQAGQAVYIGDLRVETSTRQSRAGVSDRYAPALQRVEKRIAGGKFAAAKALMRLEEQPGRYERMTGICSASWGLECDSKHQGVRPVQPEGTATSYVGAKSVTPLLEWKPTGRPGITYDVAIYESLLFTYGATGSVKGLRGTLVAYAEGLREPRYTPQALEHDKRYEWTVRLRDGDTVSGWSTTSYSFYAVFVWGSGSGQYFGFETPRK